MQNKERSRLFSCR